MGGSNKYEKTDYLVSFAENIWFLAGFRSLAFASLEGCIVEQTLHGISRNIIIV